MITYYWRGDEDHNIIVILNGLVIPCCGNYYTFDKYGYVKFLKHEITDDCLIQIIPRDPSRDVGIIKGVRYRARQKLMSGD